MINFLKKLFNKNEENDVKPDESDTVEDILQRQVNTVKELTAGLNEKRNSEHKLELVGFNANTLDDDRKEINLTFNYRDQIVERGAFEEYLANIFLYIEDDLDFIDNQLDVNFEILQDNITGYESSPCEVPTIYIEGILRAHRNLTLKEVDSKLCEKYKDIIHTSIRRDFSHNRHEQYGNVVYDFEIERKDLSAINETLNK